MSVEQRHPLVAVQLGQPVGAALVLRLCPQTPEQRQQQRRVAGSVLS